MKKKKNTIDPQLSRRNFLKSTTLASSLASISPLQMLFTSMIQGVCDKAYAEEMGSSDIMNYVHLSMGGGPSRWMFDLPVLPNGLNGSDKYKHNPMLITKFDNPNSYEASYATIKRNGLHFPHIWSLLVPKAGGGFRPMTDLLDHMICFRGINLNVDGHGLNRNKQNAPAPGKPSLNGLVADKSKAPLPGVYYGSSLNFRSKSGLGAVNGTSSNPLKTLLDPFNISNAKSFGQKDAVESLIQRAVASLEVNGANASNKTKSLFNDGKNAKKLFEKELGNLTEVYNQLYNKYETLIGQTMQQSLPGISDKEIVTVKNNFFRMQTNGGTGIYHIDDGNDLRDTIVSGGLTQGSASMSISGQRNTTVGNLARTMALTEYMLVNKLSSTTTLSVGHLSNLWLPAVDPSGNKVNLTNRIQNNDQHASGKFTTMFHNTFYYLAISACMLELFDQLKKVDVGSGQNMFEKTVMHVSSEFNRSARGDGSGSDHGWNGSNTSIFSGMIQGAEIIGSIKADPGGSRPGSWGVAGENSDLGGRDMIIGNVASSISTLLKVESPTPNDSSFLGISNGVAKNYASKPKNV